MQNNKHFKANISSLYSSNSQSSKHFRLPRDVTKCWCASKVFWVLLFLMSHTRIVLSSEALMTNFPPGWNTSPRTQLSCPTWKIWTSQRLFIQLLLHKLWNIDDNATEMTMLFPSINTETMHKYLDSIDLFRGKTDWYLNI